MRFYLADALRDAAASSVSPSPRISCHMQPIPEDLPPWFHLSYPGSPEDRSTCTGSLQS
ncbi:hypothetical protein AURDEDRAFT_114771 [Auricularia subglabra TFB-10046 SS5]|nr:hypothetical protein AURDEDRAFT_114771 [Auricularia subglabra TFB-10046 SS5]